MSPSATEKPDRVDAVVVGAGFAGLYMLYRLRLLGLSVRLFEAAPGVGGTWYWNCYPGARCDSESVYYSYSFCPELSQEWEWSEKYPAQPEILRYLNHVADRFDLRRDITLDTRVTAAAYDEAGHRWDIDTAAGRVSATYLITAVGCLSATNVPDIAGLDRFRGTWYHTSRWPRDGVDFAGKRVGVIGTGSTGIQLIPVVAEQAAHLTVFQRTANFSVPARNAPMDAEFVEKVKANYDELWERARASFVGFPYERGQISALDVTPEERQRRFEARWAEGGQALMYSTFNDLLLSKEANDTAADFVRSKIRATVADPATGEKLLPNNHPIGSKRVPKDTRYFETYNRPNVSLVDVRADPIVEITEDGIRTTEAVHALDAIVFATGFDALTGALTAMDIRGRGGQSLKQKWADGPRTYLGLGMSGFPNLFTITGPGSPSVLSNMPMAIEQHAEWIADCIGYLRERDLEVIEPTPAAEDAWVAHVNEVAAPTLYYQANSWYLGANIPGKPRVFMPYVGGLGRYREHCAAVARNDYEGFVTA